MPDDQLVFFPIGALVCKASAGAGAVFYTAPVDTRKYTYVTVGLSVDVPNWNSNANIFLVPQISNGGDAWMNTTPTFSSPFAPPYYNVIKITTIASLMRFKVIVVDAITPPPPMGNLDTALTFSLLGSGHWEEDGDFFEYPIWSTRTILTRVGAGGNNYVYSEPFDTEGFGECVMALRADACVIGGGSASPQTGEIVMAFQTSMDKVNWKSDATSFTALTPGSSYPSYQVVKFSELGKWGRVRFSLNNTGGSPVDVGGILGVSALMR